MGTLYIVASYRDRAEHLKTFVPHMKRYLADFKEYYPDSFSRFEIIISEQVQPEGEKNKLFNRGLLLNCALHFLRRGAAIEDDYVCIQDIDTIPIRGANFLCPPVGTVRHLYGHGFSLSGCIVMRIADFMKVNGYSNLYQGWGFEDRDFKRRCLREKIDIDYRYFHKRYTDSGFRELDERHEDPAIKRQLAQTDINAHIFVRAFDHLEDGYQQLLENMDYEATRQDDLCQHLLVDCDEILSRSDIEIHIRPMKFSQSEIRTADLAGIQQAEVQAR